jgi:hypothetical protein
MIETEIGRKALKSSRVSGISKWQKVVSDEQKVGKDEELGGEWQKETKSRSK